MLSTTALKDDANLECGERAGGVPRAVGRQRKGRKR
jgi:hypothetical protein